MYETLTRLSASSHACFISVTLALLTLTSSRSDDALAATSSPDIAEELVLGVGSTLLVAGSDAPLAFLRPRTVDIEGYWAVVRDGCGQVLGVEVAEGEERGRRRERVREVV